MQSFRIGLALSLLTAAVPPLAHACPMYRPLDRGSVRDADVVVTGRIANYRIVRDEAARRQRREMLAKNPDMDRDLRDNLRKQTRFLSDNAHFDVLVDEVLVGEAGSRLRVVWDNSTFGEPDRMPPGEYLIALRNPLPDAPALRGDPVFPLLQRPCSGAFLLPVDGPEAEAVRRVLAGEPPVEPPRAISPSPSGGPALAAPRPTPPALPAPAPPAPAQPAPDSREGVPVLSLVVIALAILALLAALVRTGHKRGSADDGDETDRQ